MEQARRAGRAGRGRQVVARRHRVRRAVRQRHRGEERHRQARRRRVRVAAPGHRRRDPVVDVVTERVDRPLSPEAGELDPVHDLRLVGGTGEALEIDVVDAPLPVRDRPAVRRRAAARLITDVDVVAEPVADLDRKAVDVEPMDRPVRVLELPARGVVAQIAAVARVLDARRRALPLMERRIEGVARAVRAQVGVAVEIEVAAELGRVHPPQRHHPAEPRVVDRVRNCLHIGIDHDPVPELAVVDQRELVGEAAAGRVRPPDRQRDHQVAVERVDGVEAGRAQRRGRIEAARHVRVLLAGGRHAGEPGGDRQSGQGTRPREGRRKLHGQRPPGTWTIAISMARGSSSRTTSPGAKRDGGAGLPASGCRASRAAAIRPSARPSASPGPPSPRRRLHTPTPGRTTSTSAYGCASSTWSRPSAR